MFRLIIVIVSCALLGSLVVFAQRAELPLPPDQESASGITSVQQSEPPKRFREGTAFKNKHVFFRQTGDRTVLYTVEDNRRFVCLENLALERILTAAQGNPDRQFWKIDGEYTEFRRENFILIRRAVIAQDPATSVPAPPLTP